MTEFDKIGRRIENAINRFESSFMSDSKWRKLINAFIQKRIDIKDFEVKYVRDDYIHIVSGLCFETDYNENFTESGVKDGSWGCPAEFKEIEWIQFKDNISFYRKHLIHLDQRKIKRVQSINKIEALLIGLGVFEYDKFENKTRIYAYR